MKLFQHFVVSDVIIFSSFDINKNIYLYEYISFSYHKHFMTFMWHLKSDVKSRNIISFVETTLTIIEVKSSFVLVVTQTDV